jgi:ABC-2 type transport system ATP-binding protein
VATEGTAGEIFQILGWLQEAGAPAHRVSTYRPSLDDVFLSVTAQPAADQPAGESGDGHPAAARRAAQESKEMAR